jgi:hypothetical protein
VAAEPGAVIGVAPCDYRLDAASTDLAPVLVVVITAVCEQDIGPLAWATHLSGNGFDAVQQSKQLRDIVPIAAGQSQRQRQTTSVGQEVML